MTKQKRQQILHLTLGAFSVLATLFATLATSLPAGHKLVAWMACGAALATNLRLTLPKILEADYSDGEKTPADRPIPQAKETD